MIRSKRLAIISPRRRQRGLQKNIARPQPRFTLLWECGLYGVEKANIIIMRWNIFGMPGSFMKRRDVTKCGYPSLTSCSKIIPGNTVSLEILRRLRPVIDLNLPSLLRKGREKDGKNNHKDESAKEVCNLDQYGKRNTHSPNNCRK